MSYKLNVESAKAESLKFGFEFLDNFYNGTAYKHNFKCIRHDEIYLCRLGSIKRGQGLKCCKREVSKTKYKLPCEEVKKRFSDKGLELLDDYSNNQTKVKIKCFCGNIFYSSPAMIFYEDTKNCGCIPYPSGEDNFNWVGYKEVGNWYFRTVKRGAFKRGLEFSITIKDMWDSFIKQNKKCILSGVDIRLEPIGKLNFKTQTASLDRIDSEKGYTIENIQWVHKEVNKLKQDFSDEKVLHWCTTICEYQQSLKK